MPAALSPHTLLPWVRETGDRCYITSRVAYRTALPLPAIYESSTTARAYCMTSWTDKLIHFLDIAAAVSTALRLDEQTAGRSSW